MLCLKKSVLHVVELFREKITEILSEKCVPIMLLKMLKRSQGAKEARRWG